MTYRLRVPFVVSLALYLLTWSSTASVGAMPAGCGAAARYEPPVRALIVDGFRLPGGPYRAGNRGIDYQTDPGTAVGAIGNGVVVFAGLVAGSLYVTIRHPDGLRSSYSYLADIVVSVGESVRRGQPIGQAGPRLQLGVRRGATYLDPASLFGRLAVRLIPDSRFGALDRPADAWAASVSGTCAAAG